MVQRLKEEEIKEGDTYGCCTRLFCQKANPRRCQCVCKDKSVSRV